MRLLFNPTGEPTNTVILVAPRGSQLRFKDNGNGTYTSYAAVLARLTRSGSAGNYTYTATTNSQYRYTFNNSGLLTQIADPTGHTTVLTYTSGLLAEIKDTSNPPRGFNLTYETHSPYQWIKTIRAVTGTTQIGPTAVFTYSGNNLTQMTDLNGQTWAYGYDSSSLLTSVTDPTGKTIVQTSFDTYGRATAQYDGNGSQIASLSYPDPLASVETFTRAITNTSSGGQVVTTTVNFNPGGLPTSVTNSQNNQTQSLFGENLNPTSVTDALSNTTAFTYTGDLLTMAADAQGHVTRFAYDTLNNLTIITDARGYTTTNVYSGSLLLATYDALGGGTVYTYTTAADAPQPEGLLRARTDAENRTTQYQYTALGQLYRVTDPALVVTQYQYDDVGRVITTTTALGTLQQQISVNQYNTAGQVTQTTRNFTSTVGADANVFNITTVYGYDAAGRTLTTTTSFGTPLAQTTLNAYDNAGRVISTTRNYLAGQPQNYLNQYNLVTAYGYDALGNQILVTDTAGPSRARTTTRSTAR